MGAVEKIHDVLILGGGPAGLAAGIYAGRSRLDSLVFDATGGGGQMITIDRIENYPGFVEPQTGMDLVQVMQRQMEGFGVKLTFEQVEGIEAKDELITVHASSILQTRTLIVATGARHRELGVPGEEHLKGRGVSYCATCDGAFFKGQHVAVIGGGDTAVKEALYLSRIVGRLTLIHRRDRLRAEKLLQERLAATGKIDLQFNSVVEEVLGEKGVTGLRLKDTRTGAANRLDVTGAFVAIGIVPNTEFLGGAVDLDQAGFVKVDLRMRTSHPCIFAAGDVRSSSARQIGTAVGDGITAAISVSELLDTKTPPRCDPPLQQ